MEETAHWLLQKQACGSIKERPFSQTRKNKGLWQIAKTAPNLPFPTLHTCNPGVFVISPIKGWNLDLHHQNLGWFLESLARSLQDEEQYQTQFPFHLSPISKLPANCQTWHTDDQGPKDAEPDPAQRDCLADGGCSKSLRFGMGFSCSKGLSSQDPNRRSRSTCNSRFTNIC